MRARLRFRYESLNSVARQRSSASWSPGSPSGQSVAASWASVATNRSMRRLSSARGADCPLLALATNRTTRVTFAAAVRSRMTSSSAYGLDVVGQELCSDSPAHLLTDFERVPEVDAAPDADHALLLAHLLDASELAL